MDIPHDLSGRVEATCKWLESGTSVFTTDMAHDIRARISELEAEAERLTTWAERSEQLAVDEGSKRAKAEAALQDADGRIWKAEAALAERDRMLHFCIERIALTPERWNGWTTNEVLADLRARAEEAAP